MTKSFPKPLSSASSCSSRRVAAASNTHTRARAHTRIRALTARDAAGGHRRADDAPSNAARPGDGRAASRLRTHPRRARPSGLQPTDNMRKRQHALGPSPGFSFGFHSPLAILPFVGFACFGTSMSPSLDERAIHAHSRTAPANIRTHTYPGGSRARARGRDAVLYAPL